MLRKILFAVLLLGLSVTAFGDIARPEKTPTGTKKTASVDTYLSIRLERDAKDAKLVIPRSQLKALRAEMESLDSGADAADASTSISRIQTIVSGVFISLAFVFAGVWFSRSRGLSTSGKVAAGAAIVFAGGALATIVYGNAGPPPEARSITGKMFTQGLHYYKFGGGKIKLEVSDTEETPKLIVPDPEEPKKAEE